MTEKIAILSDVHGNNTALEAVISDAYEQGVTEFWHLGDMFLPGPGSTEVLKSLASIPISLSVRGNWEDYITRLLEGHIYWDSPTDIYVAKLSLDLQKEIGTGLIPLLQEKELTAETKRSGLSIGLSHNLVNKNFGPDLYFDAPQKNFDQLFEDRAIDIAIYGHVHGQILRYSSQGQMIINPGAIGQPFFPWAAFRRDLRAQYAILEIDKFGLAQVQFRKVAYDIEVELTLAKKKNLAYLPLYEILLRTGKIHTHNKQLLGELNKDYGYLAEVESALKR